jgi:hypothetical protein
MLVLILLILRAIGLLLMCPKLGTHEGRELFGVSGSWFISVRIVKSWNCSTMALVTAVDAEAIVEFGP